MTKPTARNTLPKKDMQNADKRLQKKEMPSLTQQISSTGSSLLSDPALLQRVNQNFGIGPNQSMGRDGIVRDNTTGSSFGSQQPSIVNRMRQATNAASGMFGGNNNSNIAQQVAGNTFNRLRESLSGNESSQIVNRPEAMNRTKPARRPNISQMQQNQSQLKDSALKTSQQIAGQDSRNVPKPMQQIGSALGAAAGNMNQQPEMQPAALEQQAAPAQDNSSIDQQIAALQAQIQQLQSQKK